MIKKLLAVLLAVFAAIAFAATPVDVNKATQAELETVKGIGPSISGKILDERKKGNFKDWSDMITRVKGVGTGNAAKFSAAGLTVDGTAYTAAPAAPKASSTKASSKKAAASAPMAAASPAKK
jgi:competence protein ComEA